MSGGWPRAVVFDLDGTLVDSAPDIARALNAALAPHGAGPFPVDTVHGFIGGGAVNALKRALAVGGCVLDDDDFAELFSRFMRHYLDVSAEGNGLYSGAEELLAALAARGVSLAICTNKPEPVTHVALEALGIAQLFGAVIGARDDRPRKPDPAMLRAALAGLGVGTDEAVMVGDSAADVGMARAVGVPVVLVSFGYTRIPVSELGADLVVDALGELPDAIARLR